MTATVRTANLGGPVGLACELFPGADCHRCGLLGDEPPLCLRCRRELAEWRPPARVLRRTLS